MPVFGPISHRDLIRGLKALGWDGPRRVGKHPVMTKGTRKLVIPNPHTGGISADLLARILRQAGISRAEWEEA